MASLGSKLSVIIWISLRTIGDAFPSNLQDGGIWECYKSTGESKTKESRSSKCLYSRYKFNIFGRISLLLRRRDYMRKSFSLRFLNSQYFVTSKRGLLWIAKFLWISLLIVNGVYLVTFSFCFPICQNSHINNGLVMFFFKSAPEGQRRSWRSLQ